MEAALKANSKVFFLNTSSCVAWWSSRRVLKFFANAGATMSVFGSILSSNWQDNPSTIVSKTSQVGSSRAAILLRSLSFAPLFGGTGGSFAVMGVYLAQNV